MSTKTNKAAMAAHAMTVVDGIGSRSPRKQAAAIRSLVALVRGLGGAAAVSAVQKSARERLDA